MPERASACTSGPPVVPGRSAVPAPPPYWRPLIARKAISIPIHDRLRRCAASTVVPQPQNGSSTRSRPPRSLRAADVPLRARPGNLPPRGRPGPGRRPPARPLRWNHPPRPSPRNHPRRRDPSRHLPLMASSPVSWAAEDYRRLAGSCCRWAESARAMQRAAMVIRDLVA